MFDHGKGEVCIKPPGGDDDVIVATDPETLMLVHMGRLTIAEATARGLWRMDGDPTLVCRFPAWGGLSLYANVRPATSGIRHRLA